MEKLALAQKYLNEKKYSQAVELLEQAIEDNPLLLRSGFGVTLAHCLILALDWEKINNYLPPEINILQTSGWLKSLQLGKPVDNESKPIPWYTYPAIEFIEDKIKEDFIVFEYGSGQSTLWWSKQVESLTAIESNKQWFDYLQENIIIDPNISLTLIEEPDKYIKAISHFPDQSFDVIVVDGDDRSECAKEAFSKLKSTGFMILDDTDRESYNETLLFLADEGFYRLDFPGMTPCLTYKNCTSVLFKDLKYIQNPPLPSQKKSCLGKSYFQKNPKKSDYFVDIDSLSIFEQLQFGEYNYFISPEWEIDQEILGEQLAKVIHNLVNQLEKDINYTLFIDSANRSLESSELFLQEIVMSLMLEYDFDLPDNFNLSLVPTLTEYQSNLFNQKIDKTLTF